MHRDTAAPVSPTEYLLHRHVGSKYVCALAATCLVINSNATAIAKFRFAHWIDLNEPVAVRHGRCGDI